MERVLKVMEAARQLRGEEPARAQLYSAGIVDAEAGDYHPVNGVVAVAEELEGEVYLLIDWERREVYYGRTPQRLLEEYFRARVHDLARVAERWARWAAFAAHDDGDEAMAAALLERAERFLSEARLNAERLERARAGRLRLELGVVLLTL